MIKETSYENSQYFPKPFRSFEGNINLTLIFPSNLSNYATKADLKNVTHRDTSSFALKTRLDVDKLAPIPVYLSKLSDAV